MLRPLALCLLIASPAAADQMSWTWTPRSAEQAAGLRAGLALPMFRRHSQAGGTVRQTGRGNAATLVQRGGGNRGTVIQGGEGHEASLEQTGGGNIGALIQMGRGARGAVAQRGDEIGVTVQFGW